MNASVPIKAEAVIPVGPSDVGGIPDIAMVIPDFEGYATLRFFANSSQTEIACFQAVMKNGASLSHPEAVAPVLGVFTLIAITASFATAIYGASIPAMRTHYAHSLSVMVIFETWQSFIMAGMLSVDWPSVCSAWWSNFAWSTGWIYNPSIMQSINDFVGNGGNSSQVGGAGSVPLNNKGGLQQIYGRGIHEVVSVGSKMAREIYNRGTSSMSDRAFGAVMDGARYMNPLHVRDTSAEEALALGPGYDWNGGPVKSGLPNPGQWENFTGTLSVLQIPATDAFLTSLIWFLVALGIVIVLTIAFKFILDCLGAIKWMKQNRLEVFRRHWLGYLVQIVLRTMMIAFSLMMTLSLYQFSIHGGAGTSTGVVAIAAIIFIIFFVGLFGLAIYACFYRTKVGKYESSPDKIVFTHKKVWKFIPWLGATRQSTLNVMKENYRQRIRPAGSFPFFKLKYLYTDPSMDSIHKDLPYIKRFAWLTARFRRTTWYYFIIWMVYQFIRACFLGGANTNPPVQVYGLFVVEILGAAIIITLNPFEGRRNTAIAMYLLSISKVFTSGLAIAFLPSMKLARIPATVVGFIIIITQGVVTIALLILICIGAVSSYMTIYRNREEFYPRGWDRIRIKYYSHLEKKAVDVRPERPETPKKEVPVDPYFAVKQVYRAPKIQDEDEDLAEIVRITDGQSPHPPQTAVAAPPNSTTPVPAAGRRSRANSHTSRMSRAGSMSTPLGAGNLPPGARGHRASWSSGDFGSGGYAGASRDFGGGSYQPQVGGFDGTPTRQILGTHARDWSMCGAVANAPNGSIVNPKIRSAVRTGLGEGSRSGSRSRPVTPPEEVRDKYKGERYCATATPPSGSVQTQARSESRLGTAQGQAEARLRTAQ